MVKVPSHGVLGLTFLACRALQFTCLVVVMGLTARFIQTMVEDMQAPPTPIVAALSITCLAVVYCILSIILYFDSLLPYLAIAGLDGLFFIMLLVVSIVIGKPLSYLSCKALGNDTRPFELVNNLASSLNQVPTATPTSTAAAWESVAPAATQTAANFNAVPEAATSTTFEYFTTTVADAAATVAATVAPGGSREVWGSDGNLYTITGPGALAKRGDTKNAIMEAIGYDEWVAGGTENSCVMIKAVWGFGICLAILFLFSVVVMVFIWKRERRPTIQKIEEESG